MIKKFKKFSLILFTFITLFHSFSYNVQAQEEWDSSTLNCTGSGTGIADASDVATIQGFACLIGNVLSVAITLIGMLALVMFVIASFRYLTSGGNSKSTEQAKGTITYAVAGLVVAVSAFIILNLISNFTGIDVSTFVIPDAGTSVEPI
ncbi:MAG: pilin [Candidatus Pacebacteria bacterium]|nr:pilin [Candidatus Paceibacterota bacterium]